MRSYSEIIKSLVLIDLFIKQDQTASKANPTIWKN